MSFFKKLFGSKNTPQPPLVIQEETEGDFFGVGRAFCGVDLWLQKRVGLTQAGVNPDSCPGGLATTAEYEALVDALAKAFNGKENCTPNGPPIDPQVAAEKIRSVYSSLEESCPNPGFKLIGEDSANWLLENAKKANLIK